jgi:hypothetical protein
LAQIRKKSHCIENRTLKNAVHRHRTAPNFGCDAHLYVAAWRNLRVFEDVSYTITPHGLGQRIFCD